MSRQEILLRIVESFIRGRSSSSGYAAEDALKHKNDFEKLADWILSK